MIRLIGHKDTEAPSIAEVKGTNRKRYSSGPKSRGAGRAEEKLHRFRPVSAPTSILSTPSKMGSFGKNVPGTFGHRRDLAAFGRFWPRSPARARAKWKVGKLESWKVGRISRTTSPLPYPKAERVSKGRMKPTDDVPAQSRRDAGAPTPRWVRLAKTLPRVLGPGTIWHFLSPFVTASRRARGKN